MDPTNIPQLLSFWNKNVVSYVIKQSEFSAKKPPFIFRSYILKDCNLEDRKLVFCYYISGINTEYILIEQ